MGVWERGYSQEDEASRARESRAGLPRTLRDGRSHKRRACLRYLAANPGAGNRQVRHALGIAYDSQTSRMLNDLLRLGLLAKTPAGPGKQNSWTLSPSGEAALRALGEAERG